MPKCVIDKILRLQRNFFWAANDIRRRIPLVKWESFKSLRILEGLVWGTLSLRTMLSYLNGGGNFLISPPYYGKESYVPTIT